MKQKIYIASDHGGYELKQGLQQTFLDRIEWVDLGTDSEERTDFPVFANKIADVLKNAPKDQKAVLICGSGIGVSIAANRHSWVNAALCTSEEMARLARAHNDANVIIFGGRLTDFETAKKCLNVFLDTEFEGGRYKERFDMINSSITND